jgi:hypothetical protein
MSHRETYTCRIAKPRSPEAIFEICKQRCSNSRLGFRYTTIVSVMLRVDGQLGGLRAAVQQDPIV